jgi:ferrous-iron efflux pump FieF
MAVSSRFKDRFFLLRAATCASVATALLLICVKAAAWFITGSLSVLASLVDSLMDAAASLINFLAVRYSLKSPDEEHRFGHGKAEALAGLGQASFVMGSAFFLMINAVERMSKPVVLKDLEVGVGVMFFSIIATFILICVQRYVIEKTDSPAIRADMIHYTSDLLTNASTIAALVLAAYGWMYMDSVFAVGIAALICFSACRIGYESVQSLMDRQLPQQVRDRICDIVLSHEEVIGVHDLKTRKSGQTFFIQFHIDLDDEMSLLKAHRITKQVERSIAAVFPRCDLIIHQDPVGVPRKISPEYACDKK